MAISPPCFHEQVGSQKIHCPIQVVGQYMQAHFSTDLIHGLGQKMG